MVVMIVERPKPVPVAGVQRMRADEEVELVAFCPNCKTMETVWFAGGHLAKTRRFTEVNGQVYHDCGSTKPCNLHRSS